MEISTYQDTARITAKMDTSQRDGRVELVLGLSTELGSIANIYKKYLRDDVGIETNIEQLKSELGDALWYVSMIASSVNLSLEEIARNNLDRTSDLYGKTSPRSSDYPIPGFEELLPPRERFPRRMIFSFCEKEGHGTMTKTVMRIVAAEPNEFPNGAVTEGEKKQGFTLAEPIGDPVDDNAATDDGYRYHDSVHIAFMAILGWSPVMRGLLRLKRKSAPAVDRIEDGARAKDLEEALSALLAEMSRSRGGFLKESDVDGEVRDIIRTVVLNLESSVLPLWLWADAILNGYQVMSQLRNHKGGYVLADLERRVISYSQDMPEF